MTVNDNDDDKGRWGFQWSDHRGHMHSDNTHASENYCIDRHNHDKQPPLISPIFTQKNPLNPKTHRLELHRECADHRSAEKGQGLRRPKSTNWSENSKEIHIHQPYAGGRFPRSCTSTRQKYRSVASSLSSLENGNNFSVSLAGQHSSCLRGN